ncbi:hypothetical protein G3N59_31200 [Paraburkholderia sp. Ac-20340]|uniref:hypothetical protein n=1 Tax=Paraburkholderia sp. Ac-20340 TaxID=2703888 RepID=UPI00197E9504|nr:hypothetical protein [Paraburkholderia sp. Ac-20340]MBN3857860.1 hypothetical protein [Paraburkholderia sp. Ac-20340]
MLAAVYGRMAQTVDTGMGDLDWSAMAAFLLDQECSGGPPAPARFSSSRKRVSYCGIPTDFLRRGVFAV